METNMPDYEPPDRRHLLSHAQTLFPLATIELIYAPDEIIHIDVDGCRYTFEIGSDDCEYYFSNENNAFVIPLMD
jgi:hypothetical protein